MLKELMESMDKDLKETIKAMPSRDYQQRQKLLKGAR